MKVNGYEVSAEVEHVCLERMKPHRGQFRVADIEIAASAKMFFSGRSRCEEECDGCTLCSRIADRLIQRERKSKRIKKASNFPYWEAAEAVRP